MNEDDVIVLEGLTENDRVLLSQPTDPGRLALVRLPGSPVDSTAAGGDTALRVPLGASAPDTGPRPPPPSPPKSGTQPRSD
jgi:hypothetical protein